MTMVDPRTRNPLPVWNRAVHPSPVPPPPAHSSTLSTLLRARAHPYSCMDCGVRSGCIFGVPPSPARPPRGIYRHPPPAPPGEAACFNTCQFASDGDCDDGGHGSEYATCTACEDCDDCGPRLAGSCERHPPRPPLHPSPASPSPPPPPGPPGSGTCMNTCVFASDGDCDDGGHGSEYQQCDPCQDCADCGPRTNCAATSRRPPPPSTYSYDVTYDEPLSYTPPPGKSCTDATTPGTTPPRVGVAPRLLRALSLSPDS